MEYFKFIDGLRALAVISVLAFHLNPDWISGGFVGVDIFFVISGFLITGILLRNSQQGSGALTFWLGRFRRLGPAFIMVSAAIMLVSLYFLLPNELVTYSTSNLASATFWSNLYFYSRSGYFDGSSEFFPLLHTWSLSVEWQFYLAYPFVLNWLNSKFPKYLLLFFVAALLVSAGLSYYVTDVKSSFAFYMSPLRAHEFLLGGAVSLLIKRDQVASIFRQMSAAIINTVIAISVACLLIILFWLDQESAFPGLPAVIVSMATATVILFGILGNDRAWLIKVFDNAPVRFVGQISYSLYLWHWPVILFTKLYTGQDFNALNYLFCIFVSFALACVTWFLIENRYRKKTRKNNMSVMLAYTGLVVISLIYHSIIIKSEGLSGRISQQEQQMLKIQRWAEFPGQCKRTQSVDRYYHCQHGEDTAKVFLWGDSHAQVHVWNIDEIANSEKLGVISFTKGGCPPLISGVPEVTNIEKDICLAAQKEAVELIESDSNIKHVILAGKWVSYDSGNLIGNSVRYGIQSSDDLMPRLVKTIELIRSKGIKVTIIDSVPEPGVPVPEYVVRNKLIHNLDVETFVLNHHTIQNYLKAFVKDKSVSFITPERVLCGKGVCRLREDQDLYYFDSNHLSLSGSQKILELIDFP